MKKIVSGFLILSFLLTLPMYTQSADVTPGNVVITNNPEEWQVAYPVVNNMQLYSPNSINTMQLSLNNANTNCKDILLRSTMIQTTSNSVSTPGESQYGFMGYKAKETDVYATITIDKPADIYVTKRAEANYPIGNNYMPWLSPYTIADFGGYTQALLPDGTPMVVQNSFNQPFHLYKKRVDVLEGETMEVDFGGLSQVGNRMYVIFIDWKEGGLYDISLDKSTGGTVTANGEGYMEKGDKRAFTITPDSGYVIEYVKYNGEVVLFGETEAKVYETPGITANSALEVKFHPLDLGGAVLTYPESAIDSEKGHIYAFGKMISPDTEEISKIGIVVGTRDFPLNQGEMPKAKSVSLFGIGIYDINDLFGSSYQAVPYMILGGERVIYGNPVTVDKYTFFTEKGGI